MSRVSDLEGDVKSGLEATHVEHTEQDYTRNVNARYEPTYLCALSLKALP